jgi:hypothetical protein
MKTLKTAQAKTLTKTQVSESQVKNQKRFNLSWSKSSAATCIGDW